MSSTVLTLTAVVYPTDDGETDLDTITTLLDEFQERQRNYLLRFPGIHAGVSFVPTEETATDAADEPDASLEDTQAKAAELAPRAITEEDVKEWTAQQRRKRRAERGLPVEEDVR